MATRKQTVSQFANSFARKNKWSVATKITLVDKGDQVNVTRLVPCGYRKNSNGQYVPNAYRANFGWKNTYYQHAIYELEIPHALVAHCTDIQDWS